MDRIRKRLSPLLILLVLCLGMNCRLVGQGAAAENARDWVQDGQLLVVEISQFRELYKAGLKSRFFGHPGWEDFHKFATDDEFGLIDAEIRDELQSFSTCLEKEIDLGQVVFSMGYTDKVEWECFIECRSGKPRETFDLAVKKIGSIFARRDSNETEIDEPVAAATRALGIDGAEAFRLAEHDLYIALQGRWLILAGSEKMLEDSLKRYKSRTGYRRDIDRRSVTMIREVTEPRETSCSLRFEVNPKLLVYLTESVPEEWWRALGLHEISGIGGSLQLVPSEDEQEIFELLLDSFILITQPRVGIANAVRFESSLRQDIPVKPDLVFFSAVSLDVEFLYEESKRLFNAANGPGSFELWLVESEKNASLFGREYEANLAEFIACLDTTLVKYIYREPGIPGKSVKLFEVDEDKDAFAAATRIARTLDEHSSANGTKHETIEIGGFPAVLTRLTKRYTRSSGFLGTPEWIVQSDRPALTDIAKNSSSMDSEQLKNLWQSTVRLRKFCTHRESPVALLATWQDYWLLRCDDMLFDHLRNRVRDTAELKRLLTDIRAYELPDPESRSEARLYSLLTFSKILAESFGNNVFVCSDAGNGFRISGMTFKPEDN